MTALLEVRDLVVRAPGRRATRLVDGVSYDVETGSTLAVVGESGSGKSLQTLAILGLLPFRGQGLVTGSVRFEGQDLLAMTARQLRDIRGARIGMIFQEPMTALNPVLTIGRQIAEPMVRHLGLSYARARERAVDLLRLVGIPDPARRLRQYPFQFSGGMRQRAMIAMAISCRPKLLIGDEPTTALDVTVQAQIIDLIRDLKAEMGMSVMWITHDMGVVAAMADTVQVLYAGRIMETGPVDAVFRDPRSAYTWALMRSIPRADQPARTRLFQIDGQPVNPRNRPPGDPFAPRNPFATPRCHVEAPPLRPVAGSAPGHRVAAWYDLPAALASRGEGQ